MVATRRVRRRRQTIEEQEKRRKGEGYDIFMQNSDGEKIRVCRKFFINTLCLGEDTFKRWVKRNPEDGLCSDEDSNSDEIDVETEISLVRKKYKLSSQTNSIGIKKQKTETLTTTVKQWLDLLPKVPSHYCRSSSEQIYVESNFRSVFHMHEVYTTWCEEQGINVAARTFFTNVLTKEKIKIHKPRKDQCDVCCGYEVKTISSEVYINHIAMKNEARDAKNKAKESADNTYLVLTMDLQSVLLCPRTEASKMYYKQKLQLHNFTIYVLNNKDVTLYVWHESNGGVSMNEFTTCIVDFVSNQSNNYTKVTLISDGCNYQNRNKALASALSNLAINKSITIEQMFLEKGHTMMECDSVHATLEKLFVPPINSPSDYIAQMKLARPKQPYNVRVIDYSFFKNYEKLPTNLSSLDQGRKLAIQLL